jgi:hypothetical protein
LTIGKTNMEATGLTSCIFCPHNCVSDEFEEHLYQHNYLCFRCGWCKTDLDENNRQIFVDYQVSLKNLRSNISYNFRNIIVFVL